MNKLLIYTTLFFMAIYSIYLESSPYIEYKNKAGILDEPYILDKAIDFNNSTDHLRFGYKLDNNMYFEAGPMTFGTGYELGYKFNIEKWTIKGKIEGNHDSKKQFKNQIQTEIRYTFE
tara:strand:- start:128 stop:481 length:354 start_codon:yes stop_codon:yes gene_type:complete